jgi:DnaJ-related protein SCJ1
MEEKTLTAEIERGMASDVEIRFERESEQSPGITPGDVIFKIKAAGHPRLRRDRDDLHTDLRLTLREALIGFSKTIKQLDGRDVVVEHDGVTQPFEVRQIKGEGMPVHGVPSQRGVLHVRFIVDLPPSLSPAQADAIRANFA